MSGAITIFVVPVPKPRQTKRDVWAKRPCVLRYRAFADAMREAVLFHGWTIPDSGLSIVFHLPMPESWSEKKKDDLDGEPHQQKPDLDNLLKSVMDALSAEDCGIWHLSSVEKRWARSGRIDLRVLA